MRTLLISFTVVIYSSILLVGCSGEEPSKQLLGSGPAVVKKRVIKPPPQTDTASTPDKGNEGKAPPASQDAEKKVMPESDRMEAEGKQAKPTVPPVQRPEASQSQAVQKFADKVTAGTFNRWDSGPEGSTGFYEVKKGDTLAGVAGRKEVYGDPLKWAVLYRWNAQTLDSLPAADHLPNLPLAEGVRLRIVTPEEVTRNLEKRSGAIWVVNVLSATTNAEVIPAVISLVKNDYPVYVSTARVNEKDWLRVRVGFFRTREQAESEGKKIMQLLSLQDSWVTKLAKSEFSEFAGY